MSLNAHKRVRVMQGYAYGASFNSVRNYWAPLTVAVSLVP
jgi:hypothetical protein